MNYKLVDIDGCDWLGEVPKEWRVEKFKHLFTVSTEKNGRSTIGVMLSVSGYRGIEKKEYEYEEQKRTAAELVDYRVVRPGQLVVNTMWLNYAGLGVSDLTGYVSPAYRSYYINTKMFPRYVHHLMRSDIYVRGYCKYMQGIRPNSLQIKTDDFNAFPVLIPSYTEQQQIANFLDRETAKIDTLIEKQQNLIALLKEKRQAVIGHAVTKGLNPNVPMKDSGVEWLGEVPEHWEVCRVKQLSIFITSGPRGWAEYLTDFGEEIFLQSGDLNDRLGLELETAKRVAPPKNAEGIRTKLNEGDVVVCITGANTGRVAISGPQTSTVYINQHLSLIRPNKKNILPDYLGTFLSSSVSKSYFDVTQYGLKEGLSLTNVAEAPLCCPPIDEQLDIISHVDTVSSQMGILEDKAIGLVQLLQERRTALISAAVTGKIDVRHWQPPTALATSEATS